MPRTTADCMNAGVVNGFAGALCALIASVRERIPGARVIVSGGAADLLRGHLPEAGFDPDLTLKGIFLCAGAQPV
jgi:pantothenate kinase type III